MKHKYAYPAVFKKEEKGWYTVNFPDLEDCFTAGKGIEQSLKRASHILGLVLYDYEKDNQPLPKPTPIKDIPTQDDEFASYVLGSTKKWWKKWGGLEHIVRYTVDFSKPLPPLTKKQKKMLEELKERPIQFDKDCPELSEEELIKMVRVGRKRRPRKDEGGEEQDDHS